MTRKVPAATAGTIATATISGQPICTDGIAGGPAPATARSERLDVFDQLEHVVAEDLVRTATNLVAVGWPSEMVIEFGTADYIARIEQAAGTARAVLAERGVTCG